MLNIPIMAGTAKTASPFLGAIGGALGDVFGGLLGFHGQKDANKQNLQIAREQMAFQERMSSTAYQRAAQDLEAAGLNRILALGNPASSPGGQSAVMQNALSHAGQGLSRAVSTAIQARRLHNELKNMEAQNDLLTAQRGEVAQRAANLGQQNELNQMMIDVYNEYPALRMMQMMMGPATGAGGLALGAAGLLSKFFKGGGKGTTTDIIKHSGNLTRRITRPNQ